jgi:hypothetical protein
MTAKLSAKRNGRVDSGGRFYCPCGAEHSRGPVNGDKAWRCLICGETRRPSINPAYKRLMEHERSQPAYEDLRIALDESLKLQAHYAKLLNIHDGGKRVVFEKADAWVSRLRETGKLKPAGETPAAR